MNDCVFDLGALGSIHDLSRNEVRAPEWIRGAIAARRARLSEAGVDRDSRVVIAHGGTPGFFVDLFAVWSLGACAACVNAALTDDELRNVVTFTDPAAVLPGMRTLQMGLPRGVRVIEGLPQSGADGASSPTIACQTDRPALILFTSGTTGDPKGVVHSFGSLRARIDHNHRFIAPQALTRTLCVLPTHFGHGLIGNCLTPLLAGGEVLLAPGGGLDVTAGLGATLDRHAVTFMSSVPSFWKIALRMSPPPIRGTVREVNVGSAPVAADLVRAISGWTGTRNVRNMYGITETANWVAGSSAVEREPEDGLIGTMWGGDAAVRQADGAIVPIGEGELLLRPPSLMSGYFRRPDLTAAVVRDGWYHTGDTGSIDDTGIIRLTGRLKNEINRAGIKVSPEEIDLLLERHESVLEACTFALPDDIAGEIVAAAVRLDGKHGPSAEQLRRWCTERIRRECVPERWFFLEEIPKTDRGKLNRDRVREACLREHAG